MWALMVRHDTDGYYRAYRGHVSPAIYPTREAAEELRRAMPNGREFIAVNTTTLTDQPTEEPA